LSSDYAKKEVLNTELLVAGRTERVQTVLALPVSILAVTMAYSAMDTSYAIPRSMVIRSGFGFGCWIELLIHLEGLFHSSKQWAFRASRHFELSCLG
jgi:hypothetical protein